MLRRPPHERGARRLGPGGGKRVSKVMAAGDWQADSRRFSRGFPPNAREQLLRPTGGMFEDRPAVSRRGSAPGQTVHTAVALVLCIVAASGCSGDANTPRSSVPAVTAPTPLATPAPPDAPATVPTPPASPPPASPATVLAAGDMVVCGDRTATLMAELVEGLPGDILSLGDHVYMSGTHREFAECFHPSWGRHRHRTWPAPGNHEYETAGAEGYFGYFGARAGTPGLGYYTLTLGAWRVYSLNSEVPAGPGSAQYEWLRQELASATPPLARGQQAGEADSPAAATTSAPCALAYWHKPVRSSSKHGDNAVMRSIWQLLYEHGVEVVLAAHDHAYERFAPLDHRLQLDVDRGIRSFVVGTGGAPLYAFPNVKPHSEARGLAHGVLRLVLNADGYEWDFVALGGQAFADSGSARCH